MLYKNENDNILIKKKGRERSKNKKKSVCMSIYEVSKNGTIIYTGGGHLRTLTIQSITRADITCI